jgi:hypothetical protein
VPPEFGFTLYRGNAAVVSSENFRATFSSIEEAERKLTSAIPDPKYVAIVGQSGKPEPLEGPPRFPRGRHQRRLWAGKAARRRKFGQLPAARRRFLTRRGQEFYGWTPREVQGYWNRGGPSAGVFTPNRASLFRNPFRWETYIQRNRRSIDRRYGEGTGSALLSAAHRQHEVSQGGRVLSEEIAVYVVRVDPLIYPTTASQQRAELDLLRRLRREHGRH